MYLTEELNDLRDTLRKFRKLCRSYVWLGVWSVFVALMEFWLAVLRWADNKILAVVFLLTCFYMGIMVFRSVGGYRRCREYVVHIEKVISVLEKEAAYDERED